jgi:hypothetical protein
MTNSQVQEKPGATELQKASQSKVGQDVIDQNKGFVNQTAGRHQYSREVSMIKYQLLKSHFKNYPFIHLTK